MKPAVLLALPTAGLFLCLAIARAQAPAAAVPSPKLVTVSVKNAPIRDAFTQLRDQTGLQFSRLGAPGARDNTVDDVPVTLDVHDKPLWETLQNLLQQAAGPAGGNQQDLSLFCTISETSEPGFRASITGRLQSQGPFLIAAKNITHRVDYTAPDDAGQGIETLLLNVQIFADPSLIVMDHPRISTPTRALDEKGNSYISTQPVPDQPIVQAPVTQAFYPINAAIALQAPAGKERGQQLVSLEGAFTATIGTPQTFDVPFGQTVEHHIEGATLSIESSTTTPPPFGAAARGPANPADQPSVTITMTRDGAAPATPPANPRTAGDLITGPNRIRVRLVSANGADFRTSGSSSRGDPSFLTRTSTYRFTSTNVGPAATVALPGQPAKIIITFPSAPQEVAIPYHFQNIPLP